MPDIDDLAAYADLRLGLTFPPELLLLIAGDLERFRKALDASGPVDFAIEPARDYRRLLVRGEQP